MKNRPGLPRRIKERERSLSMFRFLDVFHVDARAVVVMDLLVDVDLHLDQLEIRLRVVRILTRQRLGHIAEGRRARHVREEAAVARARSGPVARMRRAVIGRWDVLDALAE